MKRDSEKDPATDPNALLAKLLIGQVGFSFSKLHSKPLVLEISDCCFLIFLTHFMELKKSEVAKAFRWIGNL